MFGLLEHLLNAFTSEDSCKVIFYNHLSNKILIEKNMFEKMRFRNTSGSV